MFKLRSFKHKSAAAQAVAAALLAVASATAQAGLLTLNGVTYAGETRPTDANGASVGNRVDGTVFFAIYENECLGGGPCSAGDPWGTGMATFVATANTQLGRDYRSGSRGPVAPSIDTNAKYLYMYEAYNSENLDGTGGSTQNPNPCTIGQDPLPSSSSTTSCQNNLVITESNLSLIVNPSQNNGKEPVQSWGALNDHYLDFTSATGCGFNSKNGDEFAIVQNCTGGSVVVKSDPLSPITKNPVAVQYLPGPDSSTQFPTYIQTADLSQLVVEPPATIVTDTTVDLLAGNPLGGLRVRYTNGLLGGVECNGTNDPCGWDAMQFGAPFWFTSDLPPQPATVSFSAGGFVATGDMWTIVPNAPEPMMVSLLGAGMLLLGWSRKFRKNS